jgi:hypothetical protein
MTDFQCWTRGTLSKHGFGNIIDSVLLCANISLYHRFLVRKVTVISRNSTVYARYVAREVDLIVRGTV